MCNYQRNSLYNMSRQVRIVNLKILVRCGEYFLPQVRHVMANSFFSQIVLRHGLLKVLLVECLLKG